MRCITCLNNQGIRAEVMNCLPSRLKRQSEHGNCAQEVFDEYPTIGLRERNVSECLLVPHSHTHEELAKCAAVNRQKRLVQKYEYAGQRDRPGFELRGYTNFCDRDEQQDNEGPIEHGAEPAT